jgi:hypothetical protein
MIPDHVLLPCETLQVRIFSICVRSEGGPCRSVTLVVYFVEPLQLPLYILSVHTL